MGICASMKSNSNIQKIPDKIKSPMLEDKKYDSYKPLLQDQKISFTSPNSYNRKPGNPGTWDELHKKVHSIYPKNFEGLQIIKGKKINEHFHVNHKFIMSRKTPTGYRFGATYKGSKTVGPYEKYPLIKGVIMPNGNMETSFTHIIGCNYRFAINTQIDQNEYKDIKYSLDYRTDDCTLSTKFSNIDIFKWHGLFKIQYLQAISPRIAIGAELSCWKDSNYPIGNQANFSAAARYSTGNRTIATVIGEDGLHVSYHHIASRNLQLGLEIKTDLRTHDSEAAIAYKFSLPNMETDFRGIVTSQMCIGAVVEKKLLPIPNATLLLSAFLDHKYETLKVGIGLNIE